MALLTVCEVCTTSTSSNVDNIVDPERPLSSNHVASKTAFASAKIGAKANLNKWREEQSSVLGHEWKERIEVVQNSRVTETWRYILNAVNKFGSAKTIKQCKDKLRNLKQAYQEARGKNNLTGRSRKPVHTTTRLTKC